MPNTSAPQPESIPKAFAGLWGWELVDDWMQKQIEKGIAKSENYYAHFEEMGYLESWARFNEWREAHPGEKAPGEINRIPGKPTGVHVVERWWNDDRWREWIAEQPAPTTPWQGLRMQLAQAKIREPGTLLRSFGILPISEKATAKILGRLEIEPLIMRRIAAGDDALLLELLA